MAGAKAKIESQATADVTEVTDEEAEKIK